MTKTDIAKNVVAFVVGTGASRITKSIIQKNTDEEEKLHNRAAAFSAEVVVGMMVADTCKKYTDAKIDEVVNWWEKNVTHKI